MEKNSSGTCTNFLNSVPYATLAATVTCLVGVGIFCGTVHRGAILTVVMLDRVFHIRNNWYVEVQLMTTIIGATMASIALIILFIGFLATGATREKTYHRSKARIGGRICCAAFMFVSYFLTILWAIILCFIVVFTYSTTLSIYICESQRVLMEHACIDLTQVAFLFPNSTEVQAMLQLCDDNEIKMFCKDFVEKVEILGIIASFASFLVLLSMVHYLMCLAANYAHIRDQSKFQELQELKYLTAETEALDSSKNRF